MKVEPIRVPLTFENIPAKEWEEQDEGGARPIEEVAAELEKLLEDGDDLIGVCGWPDGGFLNVLVVRGSNGGEREVVEDQADTPKNSVELAGSKKQRSVRFGQSMRSRGGGRRRR